ncbi:MAG TPA: hypothetical protein DIU39_00780 [Flavobacteriales bacterium]|mgnify:CR=1 FL=1|nr:hypothetical protein [Flavobacteriales bacterium]|tara:strand:- start:17537 stop:17734 length:198 start_codon:yes stop_codon:yes gene_type:complete
MKNLTPKEKEIIDLIKQNYTSKEISEKLNRSIKTIENHRSNICKKLNISGSNALLRYLIENPNII